MGFFESERGAGGFCDRLCTYYVGNQMKFNFYISCDTAEEAISCVRFIERMATGQKTWEDQIKTTMLTGPRPSGREIKPKELDEKVDNDSETSGLDSHPTTRPNINPGWEACQKIGTETKEQLLKELPGRDIDASHIGKKIKRTEEQTKALIQLLWDRGLINYDGKEFYVP